MTQTDILIDHNQEDVEMIGTLRLRGRSILDHGKLEDAKTLIAISQISRVSYPTILRYLTTPKKVQVVDLDVLSRILMGGLGLSYDEVLDLKIKDLFYIEFDRS